MLLVRAPAMATAGPVKQISLRAGQFFGYYQLKLAQLLADAVLDFALNLGNEAEIADGLGFVAELAVLNARDVEKIM